MKKFKIVCGECGREMNGEVDFVIKSSVCANEQCGATITWGKNEITVKSVKPCVIEEEETFEENKV